MGYKSKDLNLYKALKKSKTKTTKRPSRLKWILPPIAIILILGGIFSYLFLQNKELESKINEIEKYLNDPEISIKNEEYATMQEEQSSLVELRRVISKLSEIFSTYPGFNSSIFDNIEDSIDDVIIHEITYNEANGHIIMRVSANEILAASKFTENLYKTGIFEKVNYSGWSLDSENTYSFTVTCLLEVEVSEQ